jgi:hypothetical protein
MIQHTATSHHHPSLLVDSSSIRMCSDSDLGPATLQARDQILRRGHVPPFRLTQLGSPPGPVPARCWPDPGKALASHVPPTAPSGHITLTYDTQAAKNPNGRNSNDSKTDVPELLMYLLSCQAVTVLGATDAMDECDMRAIGNVSLSTCIVLNRYPTLGMSKGKGKREGGRGPANRPAVTYAACANISEQPTERDRRTWCCAWTGPTLET